MKVSVIIPVYNQKKYIKRCLDSVLEQTYENLEIIIVNDGSTDGSEQVCNDYERLDSRIRVIHKSNGGLSSARNAGIDVATGEYITFLDSDDYLSKTFIYDSLELCKKTESDIAVLAMKYIPEHENSELLIQSQKEQVILLTPEQAIEHSLYQKLFSCCAPGKFYKQEILKDIRFPIGRLSEDLAVCHLLLNNARQIVYSDRIGYYYRQQNHSIMHTFNPKRLDALHWAKEIVAFCEKKYPKLRKAAECRVFNVAIHLILDMPSANELVEYKRLLWLEIRKTRRSVIFNPKTRFREKAAAALSYAGISVLRYVWNSKLAIKQQ